MTFEQFASNLLAYSLQAALVIGLGALLPGLFRLRLPSALLWYWQGLLAVVLLLPLLQPWQRPEPEAPSSLPLTTPTGPPQALLQPLQAGGVADSSPAIPWLTLLAGGLLLGSGLVAARLGLGLRRLGGLRLRSRPLGVLPPAGRRIQRRMGVRACFAVSAEVSSPSTFGLLHPTVLLPQDFEELEESVQEALVCHELIHVRRRDWLWSVLEEGLLVVFWFHPAVRWLVARIRLTREQVVDREVPEWTGSRPAYLNALVETARRGRTGDPVPASLLLRERELSRRVSLLLQEVSMSRGRVFVTLSLFGFFVFLGARLGSVLFPLEAAASAAQEAREEREVRPPAREPIRVGSAVQASRLVEHAVPEYPEEAKSARVQGVVVMEVGINEEGEVYQTRLIRGHPLLNPAAVDAVRHRRYEPTFLEGDPVPVLATVTFSFHLGESGEPEVSLGYGEADPAAVVRGSAAAGAEEPWRLLRIDPDGTVREGDRRLIGAELISRLRESAGEFRLVLLPHPETPPRLVQEVVQLLKREGIHDFQLVGFAPDGARRTASAPSQFLRAESEPALEPIRVGGAVLQSRLVHHVEPEYPPEALAWRVQGVVLLEASIDEEGEVWRLRLIRGHPLLNQAALDAVSRWRYEPVTLEGRPVPAVGTVTVRFAAEEEGA